MSDGNPEKTSSYSRYPRPNGNGKWLDLVKTIINSQIGGWIIACVVFAIMARWVIQDRAAVYAELSSLRMQAMPMIAESKQIALENKAALAEATRLLEKINRKVNPQDN